MSSHNKNIPELEVDEFGRAIGFAEFDRWAQMNDPVWHAVSKRCLEGRIYGQARLEILARAMFDAWRDSQDAFKKHLDQFGSPTNVACVDHLRLNQG